MDVEKTCPNFTDDNTTKNSTQDRPFLQIYHDYDISSNLHNKK